MWYIKTGQLYRYDFQSWSSTPFSLSVTGKIYDAVISHDGQSVVYSDDEGLKIADLVSGSTRLLLADTHVDLATPTNDVADVRFYDPGEWSPNGEWMVIRVGYWERSLQQLLHVPSGRLFSIPEDCGSVSWAPDSHAFALGVNFDPYNGCGENGGLYVVSVSDGLTWERLYRERVPYDLWYPAEYEGGVGDVAWSPDGRWIAFVQDAYVLDPSVITPRLMLVSPQGGEAQQLAIAQATQWPGLRLDLLSLEGNESTIYYSVVYPVDDEIYRLDLNTLESRLIGRAPGVFAHSISPDGSWVATGGSDCCNLWPLARGTEFRIFTYGAFVAWDTAP